MEEKVATIVPARLTAILTEGLRGHHPLFEQDEIRDAFQAPDSALSAADANEVGQVLLTVCREPAAVARGSIDALSPASRVALIRLYFRLLDRAEQERRLSH